MFRFVGHLPVFVGRGWFGLAGVLQTSVEETAGNLAQGLRRAVAMGIRGSVSVVLILRGCLWECRCRCDWASNL